MFKHDHHTNQETLCPGGRPSRLNLSTTSMAIFRCDDNTNNRRATYDKEFVAEAASSPGASHRVGVHMLSEVETSRM